VSCAVQAHAAAREAGARRPAAAAEQRVRALLVARAAPQRLHCRQLWPRGARRATPPSRAARAVQRRAGLPRYRETRQPWLARGAVAVLRGASARPAQLRAAPLAAGRRRVPNAVACACAVALGKMLSSKELCKRVPSGERVRGLRHLYAVLQWTSQRIARPVRA